MVLDWLRETTNHAVSRRLGSSWSAIDGILRRAVARGLRRRRVASDAYICVDEVAFAKGRDYLTIVSSAQRVGGGRWPSSREPAPLLQRAGAMAKALSSAVDNIRT